MVRTFFVAIALALGVSAEPISSPQQPATPTPESVLAILYHENRPGSELARVEPLTLEPSGRLLDLGPGAGWTTAFSPDHRTLAIAGGQGFATVELIDVRRMRSLAIIELKTSGWVRFLSWRHGYLFAVVDDQHRPAVVTIDPVGRSVQARHRIHGTILQATQGVAGQVVVLLAPRERIGPLRLAVVGGKGMATTPIPGFVGGWTTKQDGNDVLTRQHIPALVVDEIGERAMVVSGRAVAEISLNNLSVTEHALSEPVSLLGRLRNWLEPPAYAKVVEGSSWSASWVGDGKFALTGVDYGASHEPDPAGLALVDTQTWNIRRLNEGATDLVAVEHAVLGFSFQDPDGVTGYGLGGEERFHLLRGKSVYWLQLVGGLVYAYLENGNRFAVIDPATGRVVGRGTSGRPLSLVER